VSAAYKDSKYIKILTYAPVRDAQVNAERATVDRYYSDKQKCLYRENFHANRRPIGF